MKERILQLHFFWSTEDRLQLLPWCALAVPTECAVETMPSPKTCPPLLKSPLMGCKRLLRGTQVARSAEGLSETRLWVPVLWAGGWGGSPSKASFNPKPEGRLQRAGFPPPHRREASTVGTCSSSATAPNNACSSKTSSGVRRWFHVFLFYSPKYCMSLEWNTWKLACKYM